MSNNLFNEIFGFIKVQVGDQEYPLKYTLGALMDIQEKGININDPSVMSDPLNIATVLYLGLPPKIQEQLTIKDVAYQIDMGQMQELADKVKGIIDKQTLKDSDNDNSSSKKK